MTVVANLWPLPLLSVCAHRLREVADGDDGADGGVGCDGGGDAVAITAAVVCGS